MNPQDNQDVEPALVTKKELAASENVLTDRDFILHQIQKLAKTGSWNFDHLTHSTSWSDEMYNIHGLDKKFDTNDYNAVLELYDPHSKQLFLDAAKLLFEQKKPFDITARILTPLGYLKWVRVLGYPVIQVEEVTGIIGITSDITALKESEHLLRASEEKFTKAFHNNPNLMALMREEDMLIVDVNEKVYPLLGYTREELIAKTTPGIKLYQDPADRERFMSAYHQHGAAEIECTLLKKDGDAIRVSINGSRIEIKGQHYFMLVIKDISFKKIAEAYSAGQSMRQMKEEGLSRRIEKLVRQLKVNHNDPLHKLALPTLEGVIFIKPGDIIYCEAHSNYTQLHLSDKRKYMVSKTLKEFETSLPEEYFFRIHNSYIINLSFIKKYNKGEGTVVMENDVALDVSKRKKENFLARIGVKKSVGENHAVPAKFKAI